MGVVKQVRAHMKRSQFLAVLGATALRAQQNSRTADVIVYGGSPAGLAAARAARREGATVIVVEPTTMIGGLITGGIACTDTGTPHFVGGLSSEFFDSVAAEERRRHPNPATPMLHSRGKQYPWRVPRLWDLEPKVATEVFESWVKEDGYQLIRDRRVSEVRRKGKRIVSIRLTDGRELTGPMFIDASYEGDLMAKAGVPYTYGRESRQEFDESLAGTRDAHFKANYTEEYYSTPGIEYTHHGQFGADIPARNAQGKLMWGIEPSPLPPVGSADKRVQAYCFRLISTQRDDLRVPWPKPRVYSPERYELLLKYIQAHPSISFARLVHFATIPGGKFDLNASGPFSIDYVGGNVDYPDGNYATRDRIFRDHVDYQQGFLWFLGHDDRVPKELRDEVNSWGLCRDEYPETGHWPVQLYIREARRMKGAHIMTEHDILTNNTKDDSVGMGSFVLDSHWVQRFVNPDRFVRIEGHLDESIRLNDRPYEIAYRSLTPKAADCENLLVPVCLSATHVAICTIRMEPVYMMMGHAAGVGAAMALKAKTSVQDVPYAALAKKLRAAGGVLHRSEPRKLASA